jgi:hypothetical protein
MPGEGREGAVVGERLDLPMPLWTMWTSRGKYSRLMRCSEGVWM